MPARIIRKVLRSGDSMVTALPPHWMKAFKLKVGDEIVVLYNSIIIIKPKNLQLDPEFLRKEFALMMELEHQNQEACR